MTMKKLIWRSLPILIATISAVAEARRNDRQGFNFGLGLQLSQDNDRHYSIPDQPSEGTIKSQEHVVQPYLGYVVSSFLNLGVSALIANSHSVEREFNRDNGQRLMRDRQTSTQGVSFFSRFLFGRILYLEGGVGLYQQKVSISNEYTSEVGGGAFNGQRQQYVREGYGTGYHLAGGVEIPIDHGFVMTASYISRVFNIRDISANGHFGPRLGLFENRDVVFGIAHYLR
jgi:hypothetical protein